VLLLRAPLVYAFDFGAFESGDLNFGELEMHKLLKFNTDELHTPLGRFCALVIGKPIGPPFRDGEVGKRNDRNALKA
jgi:hypothetical protein